MAVWKDKRSGQWRAQTWDPDLKRMREVPGGPWNTERQATRAEMKAHDNRAKGGRETVAQFAERWLRDFTKGRTKESTRRWHTDMIRAFVTEHGKKRMDSIDRDLAYDWCEQHPRQLPSLRAMFNDAKRARPAVVQSNPFSDLGLDISRGKRRLASDWLTMEQVDRLAECAMEVYGEPYGRVMSGAIIFTAYTGLRNGELCAVRFTDLKGDIVEVREARCPITGDMVLPKGNKPDVAPLPRRAREAADRARVFHGQEFIFPAKRGGQMRQGNLRSIFDPVRARFGRPKMAFHELRHMYASFLWERLPEADVAIGLRHSDGGELVRSTYGHRSELNARARILAAFDGHEGGDIAEIRQKRRIA